ncbi:MAG: thioredoxin domain-containing protein [bacterium]
MARSENRKKSSTSTGMKRFRFDPVALVTSTPFIFCVVVLLAIAIIAGIVLYHPPYTFNDEDDPSNGLRSLSHHARVFADYLSPESKDIVEFLVKTSTAHPQTFNIIYKNLPQKDSPLSVEMAQAAECALPQDIFWDLSAAFYDKQYLFTVAEKQTDSVLFADRLIADFVNRINAEKVDAMNTCLQQKKYTYLLDADRKEAESLGVDSAPVVFLDEEKYTTLDALQKAITDKLDVSSK